MAQKMTFSFLFVPIDTNLKSFKEEKSFPHIFSFYVPNPLDRDHYCRVNHECFNYFSTL